MEKEAHLRHMKRSYASKTAGKQLSGRSRLIIAFAVLLIGGKTGIAQGPEGSRPYLPRQGKNLISILGYYRGERTHRYRPGKPGLLVQVDADGKSIAADSSWKCRISEAFKQGFVAKVTEQLGFVVEYDARKDDEWESAEYNDSGWDNAVESSGPLDGFVEALQPRRDRRPLRGLRRCALRTQTGRLH